MSRNSDIALAKNRLDPYIGLRVKGQGTEGKLYEQGLKASQAEAMTNMVNKRTMADVAFWTYKGNSQRKQKPGSGLWCDGSAAIIMSEMTNQPAFGATLTVVSQGDPTLHGHWFVVADLDPSTLVYPGPFNKEAFTLDIWGAIRGGFKSAVFDPRCVYDCGDNNALKAYCTARPPYENDGMITGSEEDKDFRRKRKRNA